MGQMRPNAADGTQGAYNYFEQIKGYISGGFGEVAFGRFTTFAGGGGGGIARIFLDDGSLKAYGSSPALSGRTSGQVQYTTPVFNGFQAGAAWVPTAGASMQSNMGVKYSAGPLTALFASTQNSGGVSNTDATELAASYDLGMALIRFGQTNNSSAGAADVSETTYGVEVPSGAITYGLAYANNAGGVSGTKKTQFQARYALSKNTALIAKLLATDTSGTKTNGTFFGMQYGF